MATKFIGSTTDYPVVTPSGSDTIPLIQGGVLKQSTVTDAGGVAVAAHVAATDPHTQYLTQAEADLLYAGSPAPTGNVLSSGGGVAWLGDYDYRVSAANYILQGTAYNSAQADLTLDASDATLDRIDIIALTTSGPVILKGTDSATPAAPDVNPSTHIALTFVYVAATTTAPTATREEVYLENTEWTVTTSGSGWTVASTNNPLNGTVCVEATAVAAGAWVQFEKPSGTINPSDWDNLAKYLRSKATWAAAKFLAVRLLNAGVQVGSAVTVKTGVFGFDSSVTSNYQQIVIPLAIFGAGSLPVNQIRFTVTGGGAAIGFYLDDISLQAGVSLATPTDSLRYRGAYNASAQYQRFDVVYTGSGSTLASWVALQPAVGITPAVGVYWDRLTPTGGSGTVTSVAASVPAFLSVSGSPVTTTGTLAISYSGTALPVANGGTGITAFGTGVATALGVNVGSAGAFVVQGGALGTPSGGTLTNATGLPVAGGGTGVATLTAYAPIFGGTTGTGAVQSGTVGSAGEVLTSNGAGALPTFQASGAAASTNPHLRFTSDTGSTADSDPGSGLFKWNNATQASATVIFIDDNEASGQAVTTFIGQLEPGGYLFLQQADDATRWQHWRITSITDASGYTKFGVSLLAKGSDIQDDKACIAAISTGVCETWAFACSDYKTTAIAAATNVGGMIAPYAATVFNVWAGLETPQTSGSTLTVDVNEGASPTSILSSKITFDNTENWSGDDASLPVISDASIAAGAKITADVDAVGDGTAKGLTVYLRVFRT
jgi:hypothetical protein